HHNRHDIRSRIIYVPDDLHDLSLRLHMFAAVGCKAHHDLMTGHGAHLFPLRDINVFQVSLVIRTHESEAFALFVQTDYVYQAVRENSYNLSFLPLSRLIRDDNIFDLISLKSACHVLFRNKHILAAVYRSYETESPCIRLKRTLQAHSLSLAVL